MDEVDRFLASHDMSPGVAYVSPVAASDVSSVPSSRGSRSIPRASGTTSSGSSSHASATHGRRSGNPHAASAVGVGGRLPATSSAPGVEFESARRIYDNIAALEQVLADNTRGLDDTDVIAPQAGASSSLFRSSAAASVADSPARASGLLSVHLDELNSLVRMQPFTTLPLGTTDAGTLPLPSTTTATVCCCWLLLLVAGGHLVGCLPRCANVCVCVCVCVCV